MNFKPCGIGIVQTVQPCPLGTAHQLADIRTGETWDDQRMIPGSPVFMLPEGVSLLDVREDDEWAAGHAPQAVHVPMGVVSERVEEITAAFPEPPVYVVCRSGVRSAQITAYLMGIGLDAVNVEGGMESWVADGRPVVAETNAPPQVL